MADTLNAPPVLSTPDDHILNETVSADVVHKTERLTDEQLATRYEIARTIEEIKQHGWKRVALQFPDEMLRDSARVFQTLARGLEPMKGKKGGANGDLVHTKNGVHELTEDQVTSLSLEESDDPVKLTILADTSYGSCCVDEIAAEHVDAEAVIHYGRACLSPTARLPVVHIFTTMELDHERVIDVFSTAFPALDAQVIVIADVSYAAHVETICDRLGEAGYNHVFATSIIHDPSSSIPNRTVPPQVSDDPLALGNWHLFHISEPPTALLLTLTSRTASIKVYPTTSEQTSTAPTALTDSTARLLRRRYALITSLATVPIWGILVNTLSVKNYLHMVDHVKSQIAKAGKKSYLFVVGKINAAKVANFSEIGGWIVIGCWESSLIDSKEFYRPIITPFELELALAPDDSRVWTGEWRSDFEGVWEAATKREEAANAIRAAENGAENDHENFDSEEESEPPEFDLRTGRYVSRSRPMRTDHRLESIATGSNGPSQTSTSTALTKRAKGDLISVNGVASPAAEFLAQKRSWKGLGSDFEIRYEDEDEPQGGVIEEGRAGVASGYAVGDSEKM